MEYLFSLLSRSYPLISHDDFVTFGGLILSLFFCVFCSFWIAKAKNAKDRFFAIFSLCGAVLVLLFSLFLIFG